MGPHQTTLNIETHFLHIILLYIDQDLLDYHEFNKCAYGANID